MNKKIIALILVAVVVISIIAISVIGISAEKTGDGINVASLQITNQIDDSYDDNGNTVLRKILNKELNTFQITWKVLPENASNKKILFTSSDEDVAVVNENGLVTFKKQDAVVITLKTTDGTNKTASIQLLYPAEKSTSLNVEIDNDGVRINTANNSTNLIKNELDRVVLLQGVSYELITTADIEISDEQVGSFENSVLTINELGEHNITFKSTFNGQEITKTLKVEVIPYIHTFIYGLNYNTYNDNIQNLSVADFMNEQVQKFQVGNKNGFTLDLIIQDQNINKIDLSNVELKYTVKNVNEEIVDINSIATINNNIITFKENAKNNSYVITVEPKYNITQKASKTFEIEVNDGYNAKNHDELKLLFKDISVNKINILGNIKATLSENQLNSDGTAKNFPRLNVENADVLNEDNGSVYMRYINSSYQGKNELVVNGNYFTINGSELPKVNYETRTDGQYGSLPWSKNISSVQIAIFDFNDASNNDGTVIYNNLKVVGSSSRSAIYTPNDNGELSDEEEISRVEDQGSRHIAFAAKNGNQDFNNVTVVKSLIGFWSSYGKNYIRTNYVKAYDIWSCTIYGYGIKEITLKNTYITQNGAAAIVFEDSTNNNENTILEEDLILTFEENVNIDNFLAGTEAYFIVNGFSASIPTLKSGLSSIVNVTGKSILKKVAIEQNGQNLLSEKFNFIVQIVDSIKVPSDQLKTVDSQFTFRKYVGTENEERKYEVIQKRTGQITDVKATMTLVQLAMQNNFNSLNIDGMGNVTTLSQNFLDAIKSLILSNTNLQNLLQDTTNTANLSTAVVAIANDKNVFNASMETLNNIANYASTDIKTLKGSLAQFVPITMAINDIDENTLVATTDGSTFGFGGHLSFVLEFGQMKQNGWI